MADSADAYVAFIQKEMNRLSGELMDGQEMQVVIPLTNGNQVVATWFGFQNPDIIKINGQDSEGCDVCLLVHKTKLEIVLRKVSLSSGQKTPLSFELPGEDAVSELGAMTLSPEIEEEPPFDQRA